MSVEVVKVEDFERIAKENEYFFWHFFNPRLKGLVLQPYFSEQIDRKHHLKEIVDFTQIPYFESIVDESYDFIINLQPNLAKKIYGPKKGVYNPIILSFKKRAYLYNTFEICYCPEGFIELIYKTNPKFIDVLDLKD